MNLYEEIIRNFETQIFGLRPLKKVGGKETCYTYNSINEIGVIVPNPQKKVILERFSSVKFESKSYEIEGTFQDFLQITTSLRKRTNEFGIICSNFVDEGYQGKNRKIIQNDPFEWWKGWQELIGNKMEIKSPASLFAELVALRSIFKKNKTAKLGSFKSKTYDIETDESNYEVKSTVSKYENSITINSQFQGDNIVDAPLYLYFIRIEENQTGECINDVVKELDNMSYNVSEIEEHLLSLGYYEESYARKIKYAIMEKKLYEIDDSFPKLVLTDEQKKNIIKIEYTVDLSGLNFIDLD